MNSDWSVPMDAMHRRDGDKCMIPSSARETEPFLPLVDKFIAITRIRNISETNSFIYYIMQTLVWISKSYMC